MIQKFRKKSLEIEAIQWNGNSNKVEIEEFIGKELKTELESETAYVAGKGAPIFSLLIETKEGVMKASQWDWIIKEPFPTGDRDFYPCKDDIFMRTYNLAHQSGEKFIFSNKQMIEMISRTRSWTLHNPSGPLPFLPVGWVDHVPYEDNLKTMYETLPPYKKTSKLLAILMWMRIL